MASPRRTAPLALVLAVGAATIVVAASPAEAAGSAPAGPSGQVPEDRSGDGARALPGAGAATAGDVGSQVASGARGYAGVSAVPAVVTAPQGRPLPGAAAATAGDPGAAVAAGARAPAPVDRREEDALNDDEVRGPLPGASEATRGDVSAAVAGDAVGEEFHPWVVGGFIDANYAFNNNLPDNHVNRGTATQPRTGEFTLNLAVAYIRRDSLPGRLSPNFELALQAGPSADALMRDEPTPGAMASRFAGVEVWKHLARANVGFKTRGGTELTTGLMLSPIGIGIHWTPYNWTYSPSWQLDSVPYYLAGLRVMHPITPEHGLQLWVVNGWQTAADNNKAPSLMLGYTYTPSPRFAFAEYVYSGPENADMHLAAWRMFSDSQFTYDAGRFGVSGVFDIGGERRTDLPGRPWHMWTTAAVSAWWRVLGKRRTWDMAARPEWFYDRDGRMFGVPQNLIAGTYTNDVRVAENLLLRLEYRYDRSISQYGFFYRGAAITDGARGLGFDQHTVFFAIAGVFAHRFGKAR